MRTEPLGENLGFGLVIHGMSMDEVRTEPVREELRRLWTEAGLLIFSDIEVTHELHIELSRVFGRLIIHPNPTQLVEGHPELARVEYNPTEEALFEVNGKRLGAYVAWHRDLAYMTDMSRGAMLRGIVLSEHGGQTGFIDQIAAHERLPEDLKQRIDRYEVAYDMMVGNPFFPNVKMVRAGQNHRGFRDREKMGAFPVVGHKLVRTQAGTGRKILSLSPLAASFIVGLDPQESQDLLARLVAHLTDESYAYYYKWLNTDSLLLWDNWRLLHCATGIPENETRIMYRTTIAGDVVLGRVLDASEMLHADIRDAERAARAIA